MWLWLLLEFNFALFLFHLLTIFFHKGRTIQKVILSISEHPFQFTKLIWEGLYVALSRVRHEDDIRLLLRFDDLSTMNYISNLEKNHFIKCFFDGYKLDQSILRQVACSNDGIDYQCKPMKWSGKGLLYQQDSLEKKQSADTHCMLS